MLAAWSAPKLALAIAVLASFVAFLDGSVVNVALPAIERELGGGLALQQWVVDAYLIPLGALMLLAGALSDAWGRRRVLTTGLVGFGLASLACAVAPSGSWLVVARAVQGAAGALLVPSSLAIIIAAFSGPAQARAIGQWTAWTSAAFLAGPIVGGVLVDAGSWRWVFAINVLPIGATLWLMRSLKVADAPQAARLDWVGAVLGAAGLGAITLALVEGPRNGWPVEFLAVVAGGVVALASFVWHERRSPAPMLPLELFGRNNFTYGNLATVAIYAGLSGSTLLLPIYLQEVRGSSALAAGVSLLPVTIIMSLFSGWVGGLAAHWGPRWFMTAGPLCVAAGVAAGASLGLGAPLWLLGPCVGLIGVGLVTTVAPLTSAVLGAVPQGRAGVASAVNNAAARVAGLLGVAAVGLFGTNGQLDAAAFAGGMFLAAGALVVGAIISAASIRNLAPATGGNHAR